MFFFFFINFIQIYNQTFRNLIYIFLIKRDYEPFVPSILTYKA